MLRKIFNEKIKNTESIKGCTEEILKVSTEDIIAACIRVKMEYERDYENKGYKGKFYEEHGQKGTNRKEDFIKVYETIHEKSHPVDAFIKLYTFYKARSKNSTLVELLEEELAKLIGVEIPEFKTIGSRGNEDAIHTARNEFRKLAESILHERNIEDGFTLENWRKDSRPGN